MVRQQKQDRFLVLRSGVYYYWRRVPAPLATLDKRAPIIRLSLKTDDLARARAKRDILEQADNELWAAMLLDGKGSDSALAAYQAAKLRAEALGFSYRTPDEIAQLPLADIVKRITAMMDTRTPVETGRALLGGEDIPKVKVSKAFDIYCDEIVAAELAGKSAAQLKQWKKSKWRGIRTFIEVVADKAMPDITRDDARALYQHLTARVSAKSKRLSQSSANRIMGDMRVLYRAYFDHMGEHDRVNPFDRLNFVEKGRKRRTRPPFPTEWIRTMILRPGALAGMNDEARAIVLTLIETGARPSEICNLVPEQIHLDEEIPYITIEPRDDPNDPREIKTVTSIRQVPLIGVALAAMRKFPGGFPRYKDRETSMSGALNKYFRENGLLPTPKHSIYSLRHAFEDRLKEANVDAELRRILMGHAVDRPTYGSGGALKWRLEQLRKIELPFDPSIV